MSICLDAGNVSYIDCCVVPEAFLGLIINRSLHARDLCPVFGCWWNWSSAFSVSCVFAMKESEQNMGM